ncbi:uncharacterized protein LOC109725260 [Ananas comosus]|uniref:Uncharacterized protein LOC109725260 n=1 Tax=Ananas comosus TaxID=4615 RepID=A0A6P5GQ75_ANACO|nr:uncharacterized protein LOC109725260 [Ananas comosus]
MIGLTKRTDEEIKRKLKHQNLRKRYFCYEIQIFFFFLLLFLPSSLFLFPFHPGRPLRADAFRPAALQDRSRTRPFASTPSGPRATGSLPDAPRSLGPVSYSDRSRATILGFSSPTAAVPAPSIPDGAVLVKISKLSGVVPPPLCRNAQIYLNAMGGEVTTRLNVNAANQVPRRM